MRRKKKEQDAPASGDRRLTPVDVQQVEFRLAFRGYSERDVDAFLDRITEDMSWYLEESERLRAGTGSQTVMPASAIPASAIPVPATPDGRVEADEVLARAREEAANIVRRAEVVAASIRAAAGPAGSGDSRAVVAPFLNNEREFLQSLGTLVQGHAEEIKQMVFALRSRSVSPAGTGASAGSIPEASGSERLAEPATADGGPDERPSSIHGGTVEVEGEEGTAASAPEIADRLGVSALTMPNTPEEEDDEPPLIIESAATEPAFSSEGAPAGERRERSLRELFWGEE
jgi:DivIVA domain-containing protein